MSIPERLKNRLIIFVKQMKKNFIEFWDNLPAWYVFICITSLTFSNLSLTLEPRYDLIITFIFPYSLFLIYYRARIYSDKNIDKNNKRSLLGKLAFWTFITIIIHYVLSFPIRLGITPASHLGNYKICFEISVLIVEVILGIHCYLYRKKDFVIFMIPAMLYGIILENSGISFGFFFEENYLIYIPFLKAPLVTMLGWTSSLYISIFMAEKIIQSAKFLKKYKYIIPAAIVTFAAVFIDIQLDPFAAEMSLWKWNKLLISPDSITVFGVPLINFSAWFGAVFSFSFFYFLINEKYSSSSESKRALILTAIIPLVLILETVITFSIAGIFEGFDGPSWNILKNFLRL